MDYCTLGFSLIGGLIITTYSARDKTISNKLLELLSNDQKEIYNKTRAERLNIYIYSFLISTVLLLFANQYYFNNFCITIFLIHLLTIVLYLLWPKKYSLKPHLTTETQKIYYKQIGSRMKTSYIYGIVGTLVYFIIRRLI